MIDNLWVAEMTEMVVGAISARVSGKEGNAAVTQRTRFNICQEYGCFCSKGG
uniref:Uncharacterized protein n=1 Tax=Helianthus annuus TaxID=4232 RepID=A0A251TBW3_HELAN